ncbi:uncharacterized protein LOC114318145 isoform X2 [Camellia sinensis]|nr:uncharacterized protein LOC114318145 isoform X2 [Camellia sinensis]
METIFMGASATSKHHWTPREKLPEAADDSFDLVHSLGTQPFADSIPVGVQDVDSDSSLEHVPIKKGKRRKTPSTCVSKSKKATSGASVIAESMNNLIDVVRTKNQQVTVRHLTGNESLYTISECMHRLTSIPSLIGTPLFHFALTLMDNADYREVMMCQLDDDHIIGWLTQKQLQCTTSASFANLFGARRMCCAGVRIVKDTCPSLAFENFYLCYCWHYIITGWLCLHVFITFLLFFFLASYGEQNF